MELITGYQEEDHVTSLQDAMWHRGIWKDDCIISVGENLKAEIISNNEIRVRSGILNMQGKFCSIDMNTYDSLTINNGTAGENRIDLIVARYEKNNETQVEDVSLKVIQGTPSTTIPAVPSYTEGNIDNGDLVAELPVFQVNIEGINITSVDNLLDTVPAFTDMTQPTLFEGNVSTGDIILSDNIYNYKFLVFYIKGPQSVIGFGYGLFPVIQLENYEQQQGILMGDPTGEHYHSTYVGKFTYKNENTLTIVDKITNVTHNYGTNHGGATEYSISKIIGIR